ncbi:uncharacterized protein LOC120081195 [Benincasa hispida]|uniref:uncharacterized protein LOC120081195 n=1 Tax=Benincasa hispida TaxID=102211 RepID=UPI0019026539|nr:uncharacterized protein LOC120081195 [Benincasa hispida]
MLESSFENFGLLPNSFEAVSLDVWVKSWVLSKAGEITLDNFVVQFKDSSEVVFPSGFTRCCVSFKIYQRLCFLQDPLEVLFPSVSTRGGVILRDSPEVVFLSGFTKGYVSFEIHQRLCFLRDSLEVLSFGIYQRLWVIRDLLEVVGILKYSRIKISFSYMYVSPED